MFRPIAWVHVTGTGPSYIHCMVVHWSLIRICSTEIKDSITNSISQKKFSVVKDITAWKNLLPIFSVWTILLAFKELFAALVIYFTPPDFIGGALGL